MKSASLLLFATASITLLSGCGDPPPSTTLAPDKPPMDMGKMSPEELKKLDEQAKADAAQAAPSTPDGVPRGG